MTSGFKIVKTFLPTSFKNHSQKTCVTKTLTSVQLGDIYNPEPNIWLQKAYGEMVNYSSGSRKIKPMIAWYEWEASYSDPQNPGKSQEMEVAVIIKASLKVHIRSSESFRFLSLQMGNHTSPISTQLLTQCPTRTSSTEEAGALLKIGWFNLSV